MKNLEDVIEYIAKLKIPPPDHRETNDFTDGYLQGYNEALDLVANGVADMNEEN